jgi:fatty-acyl-CoA synthase
MKSISTLPSYVHGGSASPLLGETIGACLDRIARQFPDREALVSRHQDIRWTYAQLLERTNNLAASLVRLGLKPGERVGIWSHNNAEWLLTQLATAKAGLILVNINPAYRRTELRYALNKVRCRALVLAPRYHGTDYLEMLRELAPELSTSLPGKLAATAVPDLSHVIRLGHERTPGMFNFDDLLENATSEELRQLSELGETLQFDDPINIQFTSGTTGSPKGATLTHHNILNNGYSVGVAMNFSERDRLCIPVPLYHCFGMVLGNLVCLTHGACMVYPAANFSAEAVLEAVEAERCTALHGVPTMFIALLDHPRFGEFRVDSLRTGMMAGAPCPIELMKKVMSRLHMPQVTIGYGMTETSPISFQSSMDDPAERRVATVGRILPHQEVKIVDEDGRVVPRGQSGELLTRGYCVMRGYWDDPERTGESIDAAGWMHSGDLATLDEQGYCRIVGRAKDMIIRGGENIFPAEIEQFLYRHPKILDVQVIGVPDEKYGEEVCACIRLRPGERATADEIRDFCRGEIAHFKVPRYVRFLDTFPMTVTGKVQKFLLRQQMAAA